MNYKISFSVFLVFFILFISGCSSQSQEQLLEDVRSTAENTFKDEPVATNQDLVNFSVYLPRGFKVIEESKSNIILEKNEQPYILFYNALEDPTSELNYQAATVSDQYALLESFEEENKFGYIGVLPVDEEEGFELQVGVGGVKITTHSKKDKLESNAEKMMQIANSIVYSSEK